MTETVKQGKRERTRDQILIAAQEILMDQGAAALSIRHVTERAGVVHGSFYNYYLDIGALIDALADLLLTTHALAVAPVRTGVNDPANLFAVTTRQTLRFVHQSPRFATLLFDSGIQADRMLNALRAPLRADLAAGQKAGGFQISSMDLAVTIVAGAMISLAVELHRGRAKPAAIDEMTFQLLRLLGVSPAKASAAARFKAVFVEPPPVPLSWKALGMQAPEAVHAA
jgi:AcrR family transcriptional regulator